MSVDPQSRAAELSFWTTPVEPVPISGGITNSNFVVESAGRRYFVRIGDDLPIHGVKRFNELAASQAAHAAGLSPEVLHHEDGAMVLEFVEGRTLQPEDIRRPETLVRISALIKRCHQEMPRYFRGPALVFWVFQSVRDYANTLEAARSRFVPNLADLLQRSEALEAAAGPFSIVFGHNDLLASNFIDDGARLWLIDWDYAGFNTPLFDLGGLASNNELEEDQEWSLLEAYFERRADDDLWRRYGAMKCASLLRESMWSMVSEHHSPVEFDYASYTDTNLERFEVAWVEFQGR